MVAAAEKVSQLCSQFDSNQCCEQFVTLCLVSLSLNAILWPSKLLSFCLLLDLDTYGGIDPLGVFPLFLKMVVEDIFGR